MLCDLFLCSLLSLSLPKESEKKLPFALAVARAKKAKKSPTRAQRRENMIQSQNRELGDLEMRAGNCFAQKAKSSFFFN
jgi:hypothetical protein